MGGPKLIYNIVKDLGRASQKTFFWLHISIG